MINVKSIMTKGPAACNYNATIETVAKLMCEFNCGEIPVINEERKPIGVVTDRDIVCRLVAKGKDPLHFTAKDCMSSPCITITPETTLEDCCRILEEHQIRRIPVIDSLGRLCGIVSQADIALHASKEQAAEVLQEVSKEY